MPRPLIVRGGRLLRDGQWVDDDLVVVDGRVIDGEPRVSGDEAASEIDASGCLVAPGLIDLQCNGAIGIHLTSTPDRIWDVGAALPRFGVTAWLPTIVTSTPDIVDHAIACLAEGPPADWRGAVPIGLHLEGPFLSPDAAGAHPVDLLRVPTDVGIDAWSRGRGVAMVTLAPELERALPLIRRLAEQGVCVSIGHSRATDSQVEAAIEAGARSVTHLFNAMTPLHHREPGLIGVSLSDPRLSVGLIADGVHVSPRVVGIAQRALGERLFLVSDAVATLGVARDARDGTPAETVQPKGVVAATSLEDGTLAGSNLPLADAVRNLVTWSGCAPATAFVAASGTPATLLGDGRRGVLRPGCRGDIVIVGRDDLELRCTVVGGEILHERPA